MIKIVSGKKMGEIDQETIKQIGIPGLILMENAGLQVVRLLQELRPDRARGRVAIFCGKGNNGGGRLCDRPASAASGISGDDLGFGRCFSLPG
jgi:NAD(P)H-hydrate repair Nnr-like enzyme with NAD(P)H-hydrate epimerase domain